ncbi:hypothetical protein C0992_008740 [Termitomyces sp. T32_za158]|nr:hypothetical protein C0992_008740 [Termitomyces sp. T32_za158]
MAAVYDKNMPKSVIDKFVALSERAVDMLSHSVFPGAIVVNALPILRHIPAWFPGAGFHTFAAETRVYTSQMLEVPFKYVKDQMIAGVELSSLTERLLKRNSILGPGGSPEADLKCIAATAFAGTFIYAMLINPGSQKNAQDEIDNIVGRNKLPDFSDRPNLPYVEAVFREVMRWRPALPLGVSHSTSADDNYNGYFIPKATFNIRKKRDEQGNEMNVDDSYTSGLISYKLPFFCAITPRSQEARRLIVEANIKLP